MKKQNAVRGRINQRERSEGHGRELWNLPPAHRVGRGSETFVPQNPGSSGAAGSRCCERKAESAGCQPERRLF